MAGVAAATTEDERLVELDGHICRCTGYRNALNVIGSEPLARDPEWSLRSRGSDQGCFESDWDRIQVI